MLAFVFRQSRYEIGRTILPVLAIAGVVAEILVLEGFLAGLYEQLRMAVPNRGGDLVVTQAGVSNFIGVRSILPQDTRLQVEEIDGVKTAHPLTGISAIYERNGRRTPIILLVYDTLGGATEVIAGNARPGDGGIVIDRAIATRYDLAPGDTIIISDFEFTVSGISKDSAAFLTPFAFITYDDLIDFYFESDVAADIATFPLLSFLLVELEPGADPGAVMARIENRAAAADVFRPSALARNDENLGRQMLGPILGLLLVVSYVIGVLIVSMFMFAAVRSRKRNFGVLKALGFRQRALSMAVVAEAVVLTLVALPVGVLLAAIIAAVIDNIAPIYLVLATEPAGVARTAIACVIFAALGAFVPVRAIARIDPAIALRS